MPPLAWPPRQCMPSPGHRPQLHLVADSESRIQSRALERTSPEGLAATMNNVTKRKVFRRRATGRRSGTPARLLSRTAGRTMPIRSSRIQGGSELQTTPKAVPRTSEGLIETSPKLAPGQDEPDDVAGPRVLEEACLHTPYSDLIYSPQDQPPDSMTIQAGPSTQADPQAMALSLPGAMHP